jgi:hypothetical protein
MNMLRAIYRSAGWHSHAERGPALHEAPQNPEWFLRSLARQPKKNWERGEESLEHPRDRYAVGAGRLYIVQVVSARMRKLNATPSRP